MSICVEKLFVYKKRHGRVSLFTDVQEQLILLPLLSFYCCQAEHAVRSEMSAFGLHINATRPHAKVLELVIVAFTSTALHFCFLKAVLLQRAGWCGGGGASSHFET